MSHKSIKWLPAVVVPAVIAVGVIAVPLQAGAAVDLPDKTAQQVLLMVSDSTVTAFSGTVEKTANLSLPAIDLGAEMSGQAGKQGASGSGDAASGALSSVLELLSGSHTARVYVDGSAADGSVTDGSTDGPAKVRVQIQDRMAERNIVSNGSDAWLYDSETDTAAHLAIPAGAAASMKDKMAALDAEAPADVSTPSQLADRFLSEIDPSTVVTVGTDGRVAGRTVYELVLTPKATDTLVESVSISVDSETGMPLQVSVRAAGQKDPAFQVGFSSVDYGAPSADLFDFTPPAGATVKELALPQTPANHAAPDVAAPDTARPEIPTEGLPVVTGTGWDAIVEIPAASVPPELGDNPLMSEVATKVDGGRLLSTSLVNVFLADDGRFFAGSVPVDQLQAAASAQ
ncbi:DUF2092 domain-containing protein [Cryobacterium sp. TMT2-23]|uniref:LolA family protein n=1 Tax=Cryobacterium sp. TMT2-23 TaxID=1259252 RepID=UPI00106DC430|nr:DUF2092 domain-containing protein [Cryobacterium sp. TMT2-23]TFD19373.1 DUF2092 domain-containing protein [Cryobacterium sp. TMT2-23]